MAERYYNSRKGNLDRSGEPADHYQARLRIKYILESFGYDVLCEREENQNNLTRLSIKFPFLEINYRHGFDIFAKKYFPDTDLESIIIVEVDGIETRHGTPEQQKRDRYAEGIAKIIFENSEFRRIDKEYVLAPETTDDIIIDRLKLGSLLKKSDRKKPTTFFSSLDQGSIIDNL